MRLGKDKIMFIDAMKQQNDKRKALTENGAIAYETTGKELLDFNFRLSSYRKMEEEEIRRDFGKVYYENPMLAVKFLFWVGDIRQGAGERKVFRCGLEWLAEHKAEAMKALVPFVAEYNRFDSLLPLLDTNLRSDVSDYYKKKLKEDRRNRKANQPVSLLAKWMPSVNASSAKTRRYAHILCEDFGWTSKKYRKTLSKLRRYLNVVEVKMSAKEWSDIDYNTVPSKANLIYNDAFLRNDGDRRRDYLASLAKGETKINAGVLQPHEIVTKYRNGTGWWGMSVKEYDETLEQLWNNLPNMSVENTLVVRDGSGSMTSNISGNTTCLDVATALTVFMADNNSDAWKGKFVTFSRTPKIIDVSKCKNLHDKLELISSYDECSNTDIYKTMMLVLDTAVANHMTQDDMPGMIVICSDMGFDGRMFHFDKTLFEDIIDEYESNGYRLPKICFWNINDRGNNGVPLQKNDMGLILCSGFSVQIMRMFMSNKLDPLEILLETINSERYQPIEDAIKDLIL